MQQNLPKPWSKAKIIGLFASIAILLTIPLTILISQQQNDVRSKAAETQETTVGAQGVGSIAGYVFHDTNKDGERSTDEKSFPNVKVTITQIRQNASGQAVSGKSNDIVSNLTTDSNGYFKFRFSNLIPDGTTFIVKVVLPDNYKTIDTNPVVLSELHRNAKEVIEFGLFLVSDQITSTPQCVTRPECLDKAPKCVLPEPTEGWCPQPTPTTTTCIPRPACLDATPSCNLPEPAKGWCPK